MMEHRGGRVGKRLERDRLARQHRRGGSEHHEEHKKHAGLLTNKAKHGHSLARKGITPPEQTTLLQPAQTCAQSEVLQDVHIIHTDGKDLQECAAAPTCHHLHALAFYRRGKRKTASRLDPRGPKVGGGRRRRRRRGKPATAYRLYTSTSVGPQIRGPRVSALPTPSISTRGGKQRNRPLTLFTRGRGFCEAGKRKSPHADLLCLPLTAPRRGCRGSGYRPGELLCAGAQAPDPAARQRPLTLILFPRCSGPRPWSLGGALCGDDLGPPLVWH
jgi:hypothetical protein